MGGIFVIEAEQRAVGVPEYIGREVEMIRVANTYRVTHPSSSKVFCVERFSPFRPLTEGSGVADGQGCCSGSSSRILGVRLV
jgi:hypothetical protein